MVPSMTNPGKGGRGKRAPYETIHYRIPSPIKPVVEMLATAYRMVVGSEADPDGEKLLNQVKDSIASASYPNDKSELEKLRLKLIESQELLKQLEREREKAINILVPALKIKSNAGGKIKDAIKQAFPEIAD